MDFNKIHEAALGYQEDMTKFLRAIVRNPGESCDEKAHIDTIAAEMQKAVSYTHLAASGCKKAWNASPR